MLNRTTLTHAAIYARLNLAPVKAALGKHADTLLAMRNASVTQPAPAGLPGTTSDPMDHPRPQPLASTRLCEEERDEWSG